MSMKFESVNSEWWDDNALVLPAYKVGRVSYGNGRSYVKLIEDELAEPFRLYTSLTTAINTCAPMERGLLEWYTKLGLQEADRQLTLSQHYGTLMHILAGKFLIEKTLDFELIRETVEDYLNKHSYYQKECDTWELKLRYDMAAFVQFCYDYKVIPLGIEYVLLSDKYGFGTLIDLVCKMTIEERGFFGEVYKSGEKKGEPKETKRDKQITAIINFKSGRHGFYPSNGLQAISEKMLWEENFPDYPLDAAFNWSPKEWDVTPSYNLKDWTGLVDVEEVEAVLKLAELRFGNKALNKKYISIFGTAFAGRDASHNINVADVETFCKRSYTSLMV